jgi:haloalkane dehalogenase
MKALRTPDQRFVDLEQWPYEPKYVDVGNGLRMHYVDEGPPSPAPVLLAHGEPTWGYLYRKMIPKLAAAGRRVVVPDLIGFGRSDKPADRDDYTYERHVEWTGALLETLRLDDIVLFGQDWGGFVFLVHVGRMPQRFAGVVAANTALPGLRNLAHEVLPNALEPFLGWRQWSQERGQLRPSEVVGGSSPLNQTHQTLSAGERAAYDAPFPDESYCAGARQLPLLVPLGDTEPPASMLRAAWAGLERFERPFVTAFAEHEDITSFFEKIFQERVPGAHTRAHHVIANAGHFLQEQAPDELVDIILELGED